MLIEMSLLLHHLSFKSTSEPLGKPFAALMHPESPETKERTITILSASPITSIDLVASR